MEYADTIIRYAEKMQEDKETPYDNELADAEHSKELIKTLLGHIRKVVHEYTKAHGDSEPLSDALIEAEDSFEAAFIDIIRDLNRNIESYEPCADYFND